MLEAGADGNGNGNGRGVLPDMEAIEQVAVETSVAAREVSDSAVRLAEVTRELTNLTGGRFVG